MLGNWDVWYKDADEKQFQDSDTKTYELAAEFLSDVKTVADWGCGYGGFKKFCRTGYVGVDGSKTPYVDVVADLWDYQQPSEGILLRHVLEHNYDWRSVLGNALSSFTKKLCIVIFTPFSDKTEEIAFNEDVGVPDIAFARKDIERHLKGFKWRYASLEGGRNYGIEHIYYIEAAK